MDGSNHEHRDNHDQGDDDSNHGTLDNHDHGARDDDDQGEGNNLLNDQTDFASPPNRRNEHGGEGSNLPNETDQIVRIPPMSLRIPITPYYLRDMEYEGRVTRIHQMVSLSICFMCSRKSEVFQVTNFFVISGIFGISCVV